MKSGMKWDKRETRAREQYKRDSRETWERQDEETRERLEYTTGCPKKNAHYVRFWVLDPGIGVFMGNFLPENIFVLWNFLGV